MYIRYIFKYYKYNFKSFVPVFAAISLSILLGYTVQMIVNSMVSADYNVMVEPTKYFSQMRAMLNAIDANVADKIKSRPETEKLISCSTWSVNYDLPLGGTRVTEVYKVLDEDMDYLISLMNLKIREGRKPKQDAMEVLLHHLIAANRNVKVGDSIILTNSGFNAKFKVVGLLEGKAVISFAPRDKDYGWAVFVIPKKGAREKLEAYLEAQPRDHYYITEYSRTSEMNAKTRGISSIINMINLMLMVIVATCMGFLYHVYFFHRRTEFGVLMALGYTRQKITRDMFVEIFFTNFLGLLLGVVLSILTGILMEKLLFLPKGHPLYLFHPEYIIRSLCVVMFASLFSIIPVWKMVKNVDPITIVENGV